MTVTLPRPNVKIRLGAAFPPDSKLLLRPF